MTIGKSAKNQRIFLGSLHKEGEECEGSGADCEAAVRSARTDRPRCGNEPCRGLLAEASTRPQHSRCPAATEGAARLLTGGAVRLAPAAPHDLQQVARSGLHRRRRATSNRWCGLPQALPPQFAFVVAVICSFFCRKSAKGKAKRRRKPAKSHPNAVKSRPKSVRQTPKNRAKRRQKIEKE